MEFELDIKNSSQARQLKQITRRAHIIMLAIENRSVTTREVRVLFNISSHTAERYVRTLIDAGALFKIGSTNFPEYSTDINTEPRILKTNLARGAEAKIAAIDRRIQAEHDYIAQRTFDGELPIKPAEIYWKFLLNPITGRDDLSVLTECSEVVKEGPNTRPTYRWLGMEPESSDQA